MSLFDAYIMVDWSASSSPCQGKDSVWIAQWRRGSESTEPINPRTRQLAFEALVDLLRGHVRAGSRVLVGFDFPYGYPAGFAEAIGLAEPRRHCAIQTLSLPWQGELLALQSTMM